MLQQSQRRGFALMDGVILAVGLMILVMLALPAIQAARERARVIACKSNLRKIVVGLQNYHDTYRRFPASAFATGTPGVSDRMGPAWWVGILPFFREERRLYDRLICTQLPWFPVSSIPFNARAINGITEPDGYENVLTRFVPEYMFCPSTPLTIMERPIGPVALPSYVAIAGGCDLSERSGDYRSPSGSFPGLQAPKTDRDYFNRFKGTAPYGGIVTSSGAMPPCQWSNMAHVIDGTSNTIIVGEQSGWLLDADPTKGNRFRGDPGWDTSGTGGTGPNDGGGFLSGAAVQTPLPACKKPEYAPATWDVTCYNLTTVRYPLNYKRVLGTQPHPGCSEDHGVNNPLQSAHPGGAVVAYVDGSVIAVSERIDFATLLRMAIRNDVQNTSRPPTIDLEAVGP